MTVTLCDSLSGSVLFSFCLSKNMTILRVSALCGLLNLFSIVPWEFTNLCLQCYSTGGCVSSGIRCLQEHLVFRGFSRFGFHFAALSNVHGDMLPLWIWKRKRKQSQTALVLFSIIIDFLQSLQFKGSSPFSWSGPRNDWTKLLQGT